MSSPTRLTLEEALRQRTRHYVRVLFWVLVVAAGITFVTDLQAPSVKLLALRSVQFTLPLAAIFHARHAERPSLWIFPSMTVFILLDAWGNAMGQGDQIAILTGGLTLGGMGLFATTLPRTVARQCLLAASLAVGLSLGGVPMDADVGQLLLLGTLVGGFISRAQYNAEESAQRSRDEAWEAQKLAEDAAASRSRFLARMSHEIRTPLNAVLGMLSFVPEDGPVNREQERDLDIARASGERLLGLLDDLLDFSAGQEGVRLEIRPAAIRSKVELLVKGYQQQHSHLCLRVERWDAPDWLMLDQRRVSQVLEQLLSNAVKFTAAGEVLVRGRYADGRLTLEVLDSGVGLPESDPQLLLHPFEQADGTITRRFEGMGMGLAICSQLVEAMEGELQAERRPEGGSVFRLVLPAPAADSPITSRDGNPLPGLSGQVLVVEDNPTNQLVISHMLRLLGLEPTLAQDGQEALQAASMQSFDVILMDHHMPRMDGLEATRRLRAMGFTRPIIGVSASVMADEVEAALAAGMDLNLPKPVSKEDLEAALRVHMQPPSPDLQATA